MSRLSTFLQTEPSPWPLIYADLWRKQADAGIIRLPLVLDGYPEEAIWMQVEEFSRCSPGTRLDIHVDTLSSTKVCWDIASAIERHDAETVCHIGQHCYSGGLIIALACNKREAIKGTDFVFHGKDICRGKLNDDHRLVCYFTGRTERPYEFWKDLAADAEDHHFGAEEALQWGVVHGIVGRDDAQ